MTESKREDVATKGAITTPAEIKALKPAEQRYDVAVESLDDDDRAMSGLQIRVFPSGARSFCFRYTYGGAVRRMTLGAFPAMSLKLAREHHLAAARLLERGTDPQDAKAERREVQRREKAKREAEITVEALVDEFITDHLREHRRDPDQAERLLRREVLPKWKGKKASELRRRDAVILCRNIKRRAPVLANRVAALVVQLFGFAADAGHLETNPMAGLRRPTKETPRERKLDVDEIHTLWHELDARSSVQQGGPLKKGRENRRGTAEAPQLTRPLALGIKLLLATAQRRGELLKARWADVDTDGALWTIPKEHSKNGHPHAVPLSPLARELLRELRTLAGGSDFLFPARRSEQRGDAPVTEKALSRAAARNQCGLDRWTPHDLRRSAATHMNRLGTDAIVVEKVLNHTLPKMMATYNRHDYLPEMRAALDAWSAELRRIVAGTSNVVALPKKSRARR